MDKLDVTFINKVRLRAGKAINQYQMIKDNDTILVAVSGGKDSLSLLDILSYRRKHLPIHYTLHAAHIITEDVPYEIDVDWLQSFCVSLDVTLHIVRTRANLERSGNNKPCFLCSRNRRKELFKLATDLGISTLAFGHHLDDAIETLVMNMAQHANISSIPPTLSMFEGDIIAIRPLILLADAELKRYSQLRGFVSLKKECPYEELTIRKTAREIINQMTQINPKARFNLFHSMSNIDMEYLP